MSTVVSIDGALVAPQDARISVFDRGFLYGDSVFETVRTYDGKPFALDLHLERLERSAALVYIDMPVSRAELEQEVRSAIEAASNAESYIRIVVTRGGGALGLDPNRAVSPARVIIVSELVSPAAAAYDTGVSVVTWRAVRDTDIAGVGGAKIANYLVGIVALKAAVEKGANEALLVDSDGYVLEGVSSNFFALIDGVLRTPPTDAGILPGITRKYLLAACDAIGQPYRLDPLSLLDALRAEEAFLSSSIRELLPVVRVDDAVIGAGVPGPVSRRLLAEFRRRVRG